MGDDDLQTAVFCFFTSSSSFSAVDCSSSITALKKEPRCKEVEAIVADSVNWRVFKTSLICFDSENDSSSGSSVAARLSEFQTGFKVV